MGYRLIKPFPPVDTFSFLVLMLSSILICLGSYEAVLYGWEVTLSKEKDSLHLYCSESKVSFAFPAHRGCIKSVSTVGRHLVTGSTDELIKMFDVKRRCETGQLTHHSASITALAFHSTSHLLTGDGDGKICLIQVKDWELLMTLGKHKSRGGIVSLAVHPSGKLALSLGTVGDFKIWDLKQGKRASEGYFKSPNKPNSKEFLGMTWSTENLTTPQYLGVWMEHGFMIYQATNLETPVHNISQLPQGMRKMLCASWISLDNGRGLGVVFGGEGGLIGFFDLQSQRTIIWQSGHEPRIKCIQVVENSKIIVLVTVGGNGKIKVWDLDQILDYVAKYENSDQDTITLPTQCVLVEHNSDLRITCMAISTYEKQ